MPLDEAPNSTNFGGWASPCNDFWETKSAKGTDLALRWTKIATWRFATSVWHEASAMMRCGCAVPSKSHIHTGSVTICQDDPTLTDYVVTRWYRAPEALSKKGHCETSHPFIQHPTPQKINRLSSWQVVLLASEYTKSIDVWSVGFACGESERFSQIQAPKNKVVLG